MYNKIVRFRTGKKIVHVIKLQAKVDSFVNGQFFVHRNFVKNYGRHGHIDTLRKRKICDIGTGHRIYYTEVPAHC